jgi:murein DD-endopeptidase MepM/ murein hydrolase activator NlpD
MLRLQVLLLAAALAAAVPGAAAVAQTDTTVPEPTTSTKPPTSTSSTTSTSTSSTSTTTSVPSTTTTTSVAPPTTTPNAPTDSVHAPTAAEQAQARAAFAVLTDSQRALLRRLQSTRDELADARLEVVMLAVEVEQARTKLTDTQAAAQRADEDVARATTKLDRLHGEVTELATAMYQHLNDSVVLDTMNTAARNEVNRVHVYSEAPQDTLDLLVEQASTTKRQLADGRERASAARATASDLLAAVQSDLAKQRDALTAAEQASGAATDAVTEAMGSSVALLTQVADPHFGPDQITAALELAQAGQDEPATLFGTFGLPIPGAPLGSPYGIRVDPLTGSIGYHPGIDFEAPAGAEVHAAAAGTVVMAGDCGGYGNCVVIDHGHSLGTVYAHLSRTLVTVGDTVVDGHVIGLVGSTGRSTGPHLHFEVRLHGVPIDPVPTLAA